MNLETFNLEEDWTSAAVDFILSLDTATIALSGGSTPKPIYRKLGHRPQVSQIRFFQVDERYVPKTHPDSNYKLIQETLAHPFQHFDTSLTIEEAITKYAKALPPQLDLSILGVGPDGHTASLFPNSPALEATTATAHSQTTEFAVKDRLTLSFPTILNSKALIVLLRDKPGILNELQNPIQDYTNKTRAFPALKLLDHPQLTIFNLET